MTISTRLSYLGARARSPNKSNLAITLAYSDHWRMRRLLVLERILLLAVATRGFLCLAGYKIWVSLEPRAHGGKSVEVNRECGQRLAQESRRGRSLARRGRACHGRLDPGTRVSHVVDTTSTTGTKLRRLRMETPKSWDVIVRDP